MNKLLTKFANVQDLRLETDGSFLRNETIPDRSAKSSVVVPLNRKSRNSEKFSNLLFPEIYAHSSIFFSLLSIIPCDTMKLL